jgi:hypothetical protein
MPDEIKVLDNLTEDEAYLFALLSDPSGLDQAEFLWVDHSSEDHLKEVDGEKIEVRPSPSGCFRAWSYQWPWWRDRSPLSIDQCVAGGQLVLARTGWVPIEDIKVGDQVLTHQSRWRRVTKTWSRGTQDVVRVKGQGHPGLIMTNDHPIWARPSRRGTVASVGHKGKVLGAPTWMTPAEWEWNDGSGIMTANWMVTPTVLSGAPLPPPIERTAWCDIDFTDPAFLWLFGHFIAQGSTYMPSESSNHLTYRTTWSCNPERAELAQIMFRKLGIEPYEELRDSVTCLHVTLKPLTLWIREQAGHLAHNKQLPHWVMELDEQQRRAVFEGMCAGDGYERPSGRNEYSTVSWRLALSFKMLAASLGYGVSLNPAARAGTCVIEGRTVNRRDSWSIGVEHLDGQRKARCVIEGDHMWAPLGQIAPAGAAEVYDLEVEEDHSFVVEGVVVHNCARSVGKSLSIKVRGCAFPFLYPGQEMIITAPELVHLEPIVSLIESQMYSTRTLRELLPRGKSAVTHRPFQMNFLNGSRIIGRIPQRDGKGVKGIHPIWLELDEAQDYPHAGWVELNETLKRGWQGAMWRAHGVTRGVRDDFYEYTQDTVDNPWKVHRFAAMWRPNWTDRERDEAIQKYGSREDPDYRRNVLGLHGDKTNPIFVLTQLMKNVDSDPLSEYNTSEYMKVLIKSEQLELFEQEITDVLDFPRRHLDYVGDTPRERAENPKARFWAGMDIGFTIDPSEILVFCEYRKKPSDAHTVLRLVCRISMTRMPHRQQIQAILHTIDFYRPQTFAMDKGGLGLPLFQELSEHIEAFRARDMDRLPAWMHIYDLEAALTTIKGYNFSEKLLVDLDPTIETSPYATTQDLVNETGMKRNAKEYSTDVLREMVDRQQFWLPWDDDLLKQFQGGTWMSNRSMDAYGRRVFSRGNDHVLDAARMVALGWSLNRIEEMTKKVVVEPVYDAFIAM